MGRSWKPRRAACLRRRISARSKRNTCEVRRPTAPVQKLGRAYKDFLTLWKDADPDIPVLKGLGSA